MTVHRLHWAAPATCVARPAFRVGEYVHPEGHCGCFYRGPAPVRVTEAHIEALAAKPGVFTAELAAAFPGLTAQTIIVLPVGHGHAGDTLPQAA